MNRKLLLSLTFGLLNLPRLASASFDVQSTFCSGMLTSSLSGSIAYSCSGDFSLYGGTITDPSSILLSATGSLTIDALTLTAQNIGLVGTTISLGPTTLLNAYNLSLTSPLGSGLPQTTGVSSGATLSIAPGATISLAGTTTVMGNLAMDLPVGGTALVPPTFTGGTVVINGTPTLDLSSSGTNSPGGVVLVGSVPEPETYAMMLAGLGVLGAVARRKSRRS